VVLYVGEIASFSISYYSLDEDETFEVFLLESDRNKLETFFKS